MFMRSRRARPIAIDIGSGSLKLVQAGGTGERAGSLIGSGRGRDRDGSWWAAR